MTHTPKPPWLRRRLPTAPEYEALKQLLKKSRLHTVCQEARCPNQWECFSRKTATFLLLGEICTRSCRFCAVGHGRPQPPDPQEASEIRRIVDLLALRYVVLTSVTRDDLADGGAGAFAHCVQELHAMRPRVKVELLIPDFKGEEGPLGTVIQAAPEVIGHNMETVPRLYPRVRPQASYQRSLELIARVSAAPHMTAKSGLMLGLGESQEEVEEVLVDLRQAGCQLITIGQYLQPSPSHLQVKRYIPPEEFSQWQKRAKELGFKAAACAPFVRSSYKAAEMKQRAEDR